MVYTRNTVFVTIVLASVGIGSLVLLSTQPFTLEASPVIEENNQTGTGNNESSESGSISSISPNIRPPPIIRPLE